MSGANGIKKFLEADRENRVVDLKYKGTLFHNPLPMTVTGSNISAQQMIRDIVLDAGSIGPLTGPSATDLYSLLKQNFMGDINTLWTTYLVNSDAVPKTVNLPGFLTSPVVIPPFTTSRVTFRINSINPPTYNIVLVESSNIFSPNFVPLPSPAALNDNMIFDGVNWIADSKIPNIPTWLLSAWEPTAHSYNDPPVYWRGTVTKNVGQPVTERFGGGWTQTATNPGALNELTNVLFDLNNSFVGITPVGLINLASDANFYWDITVQVHMTPKQVWSAFGLEEDAYLLEIVDSNSSSEMLIMQPVRNSTTAEGAVFQDGTYNLKLPENVTQFEFYLHTYNAQWTPSDVTLDLIISKKRWINN